MSFTTPNLMRLDLQESLKNSTIELRDLSPFQRVLLTTDGMVTEILEAYTWERVTVSKLLQDQVAADEPIAELNLEPGETLLRRTILLHGTKSHKNYIYAHSLLCVDRLDDKIRDGLLNSAKPIGLLIQENQLETFREVLVCEKHAAAELATHFGVEPESSLISRTYRVFAYGLPIMLITEKFPEGSFRT